MAKIKILIVDDDPDFLKLMEARISSWGYDVSLARSEPQAIELVKKDKPDMVILDYRLPDKDGVAVLKEIRMIDEKMPVVMLTAYPQESTQQDAGKLGISAFVPKLSSFQDMHTSLKAVIDMVSKQLKKE